MPVSLISLFFGGSRAIVAFATQRESRMTSHTDCTGIEAQAITLIKDSLLDNSLETYDVVRVVVLQKCSRTAIT